MALLVVLFLHLVRWNLLKRIECLRHVADEGSRNQADF
jgi:hypothetical protein